MNFENLAREKNLSVFIVFSIFFSSPLASANECKGKVVTTFIGSVIGGYQLAQPERFPHLLSTRNIGLYQVDGTTKTILSWPDNPQWIKPSGYDGEATMKAMIALWNDRAGGGIFEGGLSPVLTPHIPLHDYIPFPDSQTGAQFRWFAAGWHPSIAMLNLAFKKKASPFPGSYHNPSSEFTDQDVAETATAIKDVKEKTGVKIVLPYISNGSRGHVSDSSDVDKHGNPGLGNRIQSDYATDPYYANSRQIALEAGGFGIDTPANIFATNAYYGSNRIEMFQRLIASEIKWANKNHLVTVVFLSIFDVKNKKGGNGPDGNFMEGVKKEIFYLKNANALPTYWVVGQYSNGPANTNMPQTDTAPQSITKVATWVATYAPTTSSPRPDLTCTYERN